MVYPSHNQASHATVLDGRMVVAGEISPGQRV